MKPIFKIYHNNKIMAWAIEDRLAIRIRDLYFPNGYIKIEWLED